MGPGTRLISLSQVSWQEMQASYATQATGLLRGGVDAFLIETAQDLLQVKCAINGWLQALEAAGRSTLDVPILVSLTIEQTGTMLLGTNIAAAVAALDARVDVQEVGERHWPPRAAASARASSAFAVVSRISSRTAATAASAASRRQLPEGEGRGRERERECVCVCVCCSG